MWEYSVIEVPGDRSALLTQLHALGREGWEAWNMAVARNKWTVYLKRRIPDELL